MEMSKASLEEDDDEREGGREGDQSTATKIFRIIKDMAARRGRGPKTTRRPRRLGRGPGGENAMDVDSNDEEDEDEDGDDYEELTLVDVRQRIQAAGFTEIQMMDTIAEVCPLRPLCVCSSTELLPRRTVRRTRYPHSNSQRVQDSIRAVVSPRLPRRLSSFPALCIISIRLSSSLGFPPLGLGSTSFGHDMIAECRIMYVKYACVCLALDIIYRAISEEGEATGELEDSRHRSIHVAESPVTSRLSPLNPRTCIDPSGSTAGCTSIRQLLPTIERKKQSTTHLRLARTVPSPCELRHITNSPMNPKLRRTMRIRSYSLDQPTW